MERFLKECLQEFQYSLANQLYKLLTRKMSQIVDEKFVLSKDSSDVAIGAVITQENKVVPQK